MACSLITLPTGALGRTHAFPATAKLFNHFPRRSALLGCSLNFSSNGRNRQFPQLTVGRPSSLIHPLTGKGWKPLTVMAHKGYKMKTHKASAKRFRVTGKGKIVRRRAGKQHLLVKKNTKRRKRLSKMVFVDRSDYDNVIGALPYLKVNRKAT